MGLVDDLDAVAEETLQRLNALLSDEQRDFVNAKIRSGELKSAYDILNFIKKDAV